MSSISELVQTYNALPAASKRKYKAQNAKWQGDFTKGFLKWNREQLKQGTTTFYAIPDKIFNPKTGAFTTLKYKRSATRNRILTAKSARIRRVNNVMVDYKKIPLSPTTVPEATSNQVSWFKNIVRENNLYGKHFLWVFKDTKSNITIKTVEQPIITNASTVDTQFKSSLNGFLNELRKSSDFYLHWTLVWDDVADDPFDGVPNEDHALFITEDTSVSETVIQQTFNQGGYCLIQPIYDWIESKIDEAETETTKKKYQAKMNKFHDITLKSGKVKTGYFTKYKEGVPEADLSTIANDLQIHIKIQKPFDENIYLNVKSTKKPLRTFAYTNTKLDHVDINPGNETGWFNNLFTDNFKDDVQYRDNYTEMNELANELEAQDIPFICNDCPNGFNTIKTMNAIYKVCNDFNEACTKFETDTGINSEDSTWSFDSIKNKSLAQFISAGTHFNGTTDFCETDEETINTPNLKHKDMIKAYAQFKSSKYYTGFMRRPGEFRKVNNFDRKGMYLINNLNWDKADPKFVSLNNKMKWYFDYNIYTDAELHALKDYGATFDVLVGAMGVRGDFEFNDEMKDTKQVLHKINGKETKISYYAKWVGRCAMMNETTSFSMTGDRRYFENIVNEDTRITYNEYQHRARIIYPKKTNRTLKHVSAQITAYQRLVMLEQLMKMDHSKLVRICVDGIYYIDHECEWMDVFDDKDEHMTFNNSPTETYLSSVFELDNTSQAVWEANHWSGNEFRLRDLIPVPGAMPREYYHKEANRGPGGTGKTTTTLLDTGFIDLLYIAPSWKLARQMQADQKEKFGRDIDVNVLYRMLNMPYCQSLTKKYENYQWDEGSQYTEETKQAIFKVSANRHMFCGDWGYQLPPVVPKGKGAATKEMTLDGFDNVIQWTTDRRATCEKLKELKSIVRYCIDAKTPFHRCVPMFKRAMKQITKEELAQKYDKHDMILCSEHTFKDEYTKMFEDLDKFMVKENNTLYNNGEIVYHKIDNVKMDRQHGFTIHSIQGETATRNLYIDIRKQKSLRMMYTAISRAKTIQQIHLIM